MPEAGQHRGALPLFSSGLTPSFLPKPIGLVSQKSKKATWELGLTLLNRRKDIYSEVSRNQEFPCSGRWLRVTSPAA